MTEQPTVERAVQELMQMLDKEVQPKRLLTTESSNLRPEDALEIAAIEAKHGRPSRADIENTINEARGTLNVH